MKDRSLAHDSKLKTDGLNYTHSVVTLSIKHTFLSADEKWNVHAAQCDSDLNLLMFLSAQFKGSELGINITILSNGQHGATKADSCPFLETKQEELLHINVIDITQK